MAPYLIVLLQHSTIAAFHIIPYFAQTSLEIPLLYKLINITEKCLSQMEHSESTDTEEDIDDDEAPLSDD